MGSGAFVDNNVDAHSERGIEIEKQEGVNSQIKEHSVNDENLCLREENEVTESELIISCIKQQSMSEDLNVGQLSDTSMYRQQQKNCESLHKAFKDAKKGKKWICYNR